MEKNIFKRLELKNIVLLLFFWIFISFPLFGTRFIPTHDGEYHLIRIHEFSTMLQTGNIFPRWAPGLNSGYGFPLFIFHYPFPNYIGSIIHLVGIPLVQSFQIAIALGILLAAIACYLTLKKISTSSLALQGTILFLTIPYLYVDMYVRGSIGEIWGIALTLCAFAGIVWKKPFCIAVSISLLLISHNIMALIMLPIIFVYTLLYYRNSIKYIIWGIIISTYFWLPAFLERKYVVGLNSVTYSDHFSTLVQLLFPSWGTNFSQPGMALNEMSQQIGIASLVVFVTGIFFCIKNRHLTRSNSNITFFLIMTLFSFIFMLSISNVVWQFLPIVQYIQYPWRLLSVPLITIPIVFVFATRRIHIYIRWVFILVAILLSLSYMRPVTYEPRDDAYYLSRKEFTDGTSSLGNSFSTIWTPWIKERSTSVVSLEPEKGNITDVHLESIDVSFNVVLQQASKVTIRRTYYPGWSVMYNNNNIPIEFTSNGLINIDLPSGNGRIVATFGETMERKIADGISLVALLSLVGFGILKRRYEDRN